jgi:hypothetical protein
MALVHGNNPIVTSGLVLCLDAANSKSYPGSGTTWTDLSGGGNNGTLTNGPTFNSGNGGTIVFDGSNDFIDFTTDSNLLPTAGLTVSAWFKTTVADKWILHKSNTLNTIGYNFNGSSNGTADFIVNGSGVNSGFSIATGNWINLVGTWTPSTSIRMYRDGVLNSTSTTSIPASITDPSTIIEIGRRSSGGDYWNGTIASVSIYNRALTATEIAQNYNALKSRYI